jgi:DHA1 family solute carrier family 18 vesicular amine transporter 1/2
MNTTVPRSAQAALAVCLLASFVEGVTASIIVPVLPPLLAARGVSGMDIGLVFSGYGAGLVLSTPIVGLWVDRRGARRPMLSGLALLLVASLLLAYAEALWLLVLARALQGVACATTWSAGLTWLAWTWRDLDRGRAMGLFLSANAVGMLAGPLLGGLLVDLIDPRAPMLLCAALAALDGAARLTLSGPDLPPGPGGLRLQAAHLPLLLTVALGAVALSVAEPLLPVHLTRLDLGPAAIGALFAVATATYSVCAPLAERVGQRTGHLRAAALGLLLVSLTLPALAAIRSSWLGVPLFMAWGAACALAVAPTMPALAAMAEENHAPGATFALFNTAFAAGLMVAPAGAAALAERIGLSGALLTIGGALAIAGATLWLPPPR